MTPAWPRVHVRPDAVHGTRLVLDAGETRHLQRVLRLRVGDRVRAMDGAGHEWTVRLTTVGPRAAEGEILEAGAPPHESPLPLTLAQGLPKGDKLESIIRMSTELGVAAVAPLLTERSVARADAARLTGRRARWERVAREAAKQCGRAVVPAVAAPVALADWLAAWPGDGLLLCLWEGESAPFAEVLPARAPERAAVVVGPEGGLATDEVATLRAAGAVVAGLGPRLLRTETAGPVAVALLQARWGDLGTAATRPAP
jgi:16S rRNA (uracil1498-N3)-methyltransferase